MINFVGILVYFASILGKQEFSIYINTKCLRIFVVLRIHENNHTQDNIIAAPQLSAFIFQIEIIICNSL